MISPSLYRTPIERLRRPLSVVFAFILIAGLAFTRPARSELLIYEALEMLGFLMIFIAVLGRIWCILYIGGRKNRELCSSGPYAISRNPLYLFSFIGVLGVCIGAENLIMAAITAGIFLCFYHFVIRMEETRLAAIFGGEFERYRSEVPRFWPLWPKPLVSHTLEVDGRAFTRALSEVFWFLFAIILIEILGIAKGFQGWPSYLLPI